jgi:preprotein translocase subunit SecF
MAWLKAIRLLPENTHFDFVRWRYVSYGVMVLIFVLTIVSLLWRGLNVGIDFAGGVLVEIAAEQPIDLTALRQDIDKLQFGDVQIQNVDGSSGAIIRIGQRGDEKANMEAVAKIREVLGNKFEYRRVELVGPKVGAELLRDGAIATILSIIAITLYVAFRFEWQFGVAALVATFHDVFVTLGLFSILQLNFDLTAVAALLTLAGYSINDTVVVFDRIRETLKTRPQNLDLRLIINESINQTLSRTIMTSLTTLIAILPLLIYGGEALYNFTLAMTWGIFVGTYSSIFVAACLLLYLPPLARGRAAKPGLSHKANSPTGQEGGQG